jgi:hypothetical protein
MFGQMIWLSWCKNEVVCVSEILWMCRERMNMNVMFTDMTRNGMLLDVSDSVDQNL